MTPPAGTSNIDATQIAGAAYQSLGAVDNTLIAQGGYQSLLCSGIAAVEPECYKIGDMVAERYEVLAIHQGSMGVVYGTFDHNEKLPRALKTLQRRFAESKSMLALFKEEAAVWVRLEKHPFIVHAYRVQNIEAQPYVISEYIRGAEGMGGDLRNWLGHPKLTLPVAVEMALQIAQGMQHAQRKIPGMVHRDLKPANILVADLGTAMVTDFGLVCAVESSAGTPAYMAPEQWRGETNTTGTDLYAFGCILYEMFTGHRMFAADTVQEWKSAHLSLSPVPPRSLNPLLPPEMEALVMGCLEKGENGRPQTWDDVVAECARWFHQVTGQPAVLDFTAYDLTVSELIAASHSVGQLGKRSEQIEILNRALVLDPNNRNAWFSKGVVLRDLTRSDDALGAFDRALAIDPNYRDAWNNKGVVLDDMDRGDDALVAYDRALGIDPNCASGWKNKGNALNKLDRKAEALVAYDRALAIDLNDRNAWYNKGVVLHTLTRSDEALGAFDRALAIDPNDRDAWYSKGNALNTLGRKAEALVAYDRALAIDPNNRNAWYNKGVVLHTLGRRDEALVAYDRALAIDPNYAIALKNKGVVLKALGRVV